MKIKEKTQTRDQNSNDNMISKSKNKYRLLVERANDGMVIVQDRLIKYINPSLAKMTGYLREELLNTPFTDYIHPDCIEVVSRYTQRMKGLNVPNIYETKIITNRGNILDVEINATLFTYQDRPADLVIIRDITERKRTENLIRLAKLEEERYHGMLSHFLNNDLQKIVNELEFLSLSYKSSHIIDEESIHKIIDIVHRSSKTIEIVSKIFDVLKSPFAQQEQKKSLNLQKILDFTLYGLQSSITSPSEITIRRETLDFNILVDDYLEDVFYHVLLYLLSSNQKNWPIVIEGSHNPSYYCISVRDFCSQPIPKEIIFSLSEIPIDELNSQGHYLGISLVSIIMQYYGGFLKIRPLDQKGNEFQLYFPLRLIQP
ncbi:MAG: PAS domain S-box protein [Candidatus Heimdallarchaeota archaeon]|nr:MAG: PAS domain S-box protein [Candidatus Heimdallarchaeota archaeon]